MGADFLHSWIPLFAMTEARHRELKDIVSELPDDDKALPDGFETSREWKDRLLSDIEAVYEMGDREVGMLDLPGSDYGVLLTGGMSWGDSPTEAYDVFSRIGECNPLFMAMERFARQDACSEGLQAAIARMDSSEKENFFEQARKFGLI